MPREDALFSAVFPDHLLASMPDMANVSSPECRAGTWGWPSLLAGCGKGLCSCWNTRPALLASGLYARVGDRRACSTAREPGDRMGHGQGLAPIIGAGFSWIALVHSGLRRGSRGRPAASVYALCRSLHPWLRLGKPYSHAPLIQDRQGRILAPTEEGIARWNGNEWQIIGRANG